MPKRSIGLTLLMAGVAIAYDPFAARFAALRVPILGYLAAALGFTPALYIGCACAFFGLCLVIASSFEKK